MRTRTSLFVMRYIACLVLSGLTCMGLGLWCVFEPVNGNASIMPRPVWWRVRARRHVRELEEALARAARGLGE